MDSTIHNIDPEKMILNGHIPIECWEQYWLEKQLRPFEVKMLALKRCKKHVLEKAAKARISAQEMLAELGEFSPEDQVHKFIVSPGIEGFAWGGYARVRNGTIQQWVRTWFS